METDGKQKGISWRRLEKGAREMSPQQEVQQQLVLGTEFSPINVNINLPLNCNKTLNVIPFVPFILLL